METGNGADVAELDRWLEERNLVGSWSRQERLDAPPYPPYLWKWGPIRDGLLEAGRLLDADPEMAKKMAGYKHMGFGHPGMPAGVMPTINMGAQVLTPGEHGEARRHLQAELRFIVEGHPGAFAVVEGERFPMETGDLMNTPAWSWYDWANEGDQPVLWINAGDLALTRLVNRFREVHPLNRQIVDKPDGYFERLLGGARPTWIEQSLPTPPYRYPWAETRQALEDMRTAGESDPWDGFLLIYADPLTGGPTTPTMAAEIQLLSPGMKTSGHRHNATVRYHVVEGSGATVVDGQRLEWEARDSFVVPPWSWHNHENSGGADAILFSITDRPSMEALAFHSGENQP